MSDLRPICVRCERSMRAEKNGVIVKYTHHSRQHCDLYKCPDCEYEVIVGCGLPYTVAPFSAYHYERRE